MQATTADLSVLPPEELERLSHCFDRVPLPENETEKSALLRRREAHLTNQFRAWIALLSLPNNIESFDRYLIDVAGESFGAGLLACDFVQRRIVAWQNETAPAGLRGKDAKVTNGLLKMRRLFAAIDKGERIALGISKRTPTPVDRPVYELLADQCTVLRERLKICAHPTIGDLKRIIETESETFSPLYYLRQDFYDFCEHKSPEEARMFIEGRPGIGPKEFAGLFMASWDGRNAKGMMEDIYKMR